MKGLISPVCSLAALGYLVLRSLPRSVQEIHRGYRGHLHREGRAPGPPGGRPVRQQRLSQR